MNDGVQRFILKVYFIEITNLLNEQDHPTKQGNYKNYNCLDLYFKKIIQKLYYLILNAFLILLT